MLACTFRPQRLDLRRTRLIDPPSAPLLDHPVPVRAMGPQRPGRDRGRNHRHVLGERRRRRPRRPHPQQVLRRDAHPLQQQPRGVQLRLPNRRPAHDASPPITIARAGTSRRSSSGMGVGDEHIGRTVRDQQHPITGRQATPAPCRQRQHQEAATIDHTDAVRSGTGHDQAGPFPNIEPGARRPAERLDDAAVGDPPALAHRAQRVDGVRHRRGNARQGRQRQRITTPTSSNLRAAWASGGRNQCGHGRSGHHHRRTRCVSDDVWKLRTHASRSCPEGDLNPHTLYGH